MSCKVSKIKMTGTKLLTGNFIPFPDDFHCQDMITNPEQFEPYERPTDILGSHFLKFNCTQKQLILGTVRRFIHLDFYRKRFSIRGNFEGIVFEERGYQIKSYYLDEKDKFCVVFEFANGADTQYCNFESKEEINQLFESLENFLDSCRKKTPGQQTKNSV